MLALAALIILLLLITGGASTALLGTSPVPMLTERQAVEEVTPAREDVEEDAPAEEAAEEIPEFEWPPPQASTFANIPSEFFAKPTGETIYLADVQGKLTTALRQQGYSEPTYYRIPDGFAMVTTLEQFLPDGSPKPPPGRFLEEIGPLPEFSLSAYIEALFTADPGYYRVLVFTVTPQPFVQKERTVSRSEASAWLHGGASKLPESIASREYTQDYLTTALVYEFEQPGRGQQPFFHTAPLVPGEAHLRQARIWSALGG